jgi:predicted Zn-dependent protease
MTQFVGREFDRARFQATLDNFLAQRRWRSARHVLTRALRTFPGEHWLMARLSLVLRQQGNWREAQRWAHRALAVERRCPLARWELAAALLGEGKVVESLPYLLALKRRGIKSLATGVCGEGFPWAQGLLGDVHYELARIKERQGNAAAAIRHYRASLPMLAAGTSETPRSEATRTLRSLEDKVSGRHSRRRRPRSRRWRRSSSVMARPSSRS